MTSHATHARRSAFARTGGKVLARLVGPVMRGIQKTRRDQFETLGPQRGAVVFLGDSITEGGLWSEWLPSAPVSNRGIGGEVTAQMLARLSSAVDQPRAVFFLGGTNDLTAGESVGDIAVRIAAIVDEIHRIAPGCPVFVQSVMPRKASFAGDILELNKHLTEIAVSRPSVTYVDLWAALSTPEGALRAEFTYDTIHLNGAGYAAWTKVLAPIVDQLRERTIVVEESATSC